MRMDSTRGRDAMTESTEVRCGPQRTEHLNAAENWRGRTAVVSVLGEMDMMTAPPLEAATDAAAGMDVLLVANRTVTRAARFGVVANSRNTRQPIELVGLHHVVPIYGMLDDALRDPLRGLRFSRPSKTAEGRPPFTESAKRDFDGFRPLYPARYYSDNTR